MVAVLIAAVHDARTGRIPNWLTWPAATFGVLIHFALGGLGPLLSSISGLLLGATVPLVLYRASRGKAIGGGDIKLFAALGSLLGPRTGLEAQMTAYLVLSLLALVQLAYSGKLLQVIGNVAQLVVNCVLPRHRRLTPSATALTEMRMGPAIAAAVIINIHGESLVRQLPWIN